VGREHCVTPFAEERPQLVRQLAHCVVCSPAVPGLRLKWDADERT
jgi:hypothetical protein